MISFKIRLSSFDFSITQNLKRPPPRGTPRTISRHLFESFCITAAANLRHFIFVNSSTALVRNTEVVLTACHVPSSFTVEEWAGFLLPWVSLLYGAS
ncbi:hypothetical protein Hypma_014465 [Hypsizygus marmoreus]|uniref:Uncharacterized protein n=1 Tax=Hypsizygus marmoreus TaxID=39966 RepID=A0A369JI46_HYPMA|nr:hypothetical protein Hypma_014465 [Hypsizygus marmoreus]